MQTPTHANLNGSDYVPERDNPRLHTQLDRVFNVMKDGAWHTLAEIAEKSGAPEPSVSAQLRHLRKPRFGSFKVTKERVGEGGLYRYQLNA